MPSFSRLHVALAALTLVAVSIYLTLTSPATGAADGPPPAPVAVETSMHEFMEYVYQPTYLRLKAAMAKEPADKAGWKPIKADSLILAESSNLLLHRGEAASQEWLDQSVAVREAGGELYKSAQKRDFKTARAAYEKMITKCNACHTDFADGKHILQP